MTPVGEDINMVNTVGRPYNFTRSHVLITLGVGWAAFGLALIFNLLYYVLHPSQVSFYLNFLFVHNNGEFSPMRTLTSFYTVVGIMIIFNVVFNERRNVNVTNIQEKLVVAVVGFEIDLVNCSVTG